MKPQESGRRPRAPGQAQRSAPPRRPPSGGWGRSESAGVQCLRSSVAGVRRAIALPNVGKPAAVVQLARDAEAAGWDGFFVWDHVQIYAAARVEVHDPWMLLAVIAAGTSNVRLGAMVTPPSRRRPWQLAKQIVTLDHLSNGRAPESLPAAQHRHQVEQASVQSKTCPHTAFGGVSAGASLGSPRVDVRGTSMGEPANGLSHRPPLRSAGRRCPYR